MSSYSETCRFFPVGSTYNPQPGFWAQKCEKKGYTRVYTGGTLFILHVPKGGSDQAFPSNLPDPVRLQLQRHPDFGKDNLGPHSNPWAWAEHS